jgi:hypothetical protein
MKTILMIIAIYASIHAAASWATHTGEALVAKHQGAIK